MRNIIHHYGDSLIHMPKERRRKIIVEFALEEKISYIKRTLKSFGVEYDVWFSEKTLHESGSVLRAINSLQEKGYIYEKEGAWWFKTNSSEED